MKDFENDNLVQFPVLKGRGAFPENDEISQESEDYDLIDELIQDMEALAESEGLEIEKFNSPIPHLKMDMNYIGQMQSIDEVISSMRNRMDELREANQRTRYYQNEIDLYNSTH